MFVNFRIYHASQVNTEEYIIQSSCGNYKRKTWLIKGSQDNNHPLCLFLDAEHYINVVPSTNNMNALPIIESLIKNDKVPSMSILFVEHVNGDARHEDYTCNPNYAKFIAKDVVEWAKKQVPSIRSENNIICGLSLSGLLGAYISLHYPKVFSYCLSQSGSFWWKHEWFRKMATNLSAKHQRYWLSVGNEETDVNVSHPPSGLFQEINQIEGVKKAVVLLQELGGEVNFNLFKGGHKVEPLKAELPIALKWLLSDT